MFTKNLRILGQILHLQWPAQTSIKMGQKMDFVLYGLNKILKKFKNEEIKRKLGQMRNIFSYACNVVKKYTHELDSNSYVGPKFY
jgi:hypothetical protein